MKRRHMRRWIEAMRGEIEEIADLWHEASKPKRARVVSRESVRVELDRATRNLRRLLKAGRRGLSSGT